jgi:glycosyltransferase involved in cell wall biosynthesis
MPLINEKYCKVTIYVPTYNSEHTIQKTLESILNQTHKNLIIKIYDNNSSDRTLEIINKIKTDKVIINKSEYTVSAEENYNKCIDDFETEYACIFHSDDIYHPRIIENQLNFFKNRNILATFVDGYIINEKDEVIGKILSSKKIKNQKTINQADLFKYILKHSNFLITPSVMINVKKYKKYKIGYFLYDKYKDSADLDIWLKLSRYEMGIGILDEKLIYYRHSNKQLSYKHRISIKKSIFFEVIFDYLKKKEIINILDKQDYLNYKILLLRDDCSRLINLLILYNFVKANNLLKTIRVKDFRYFLYNIKVTKSLLIFCVVFIIIKFNLKKIGPNIAFRFKKFIN